MSSCWPILKVSISLLLVTSHFQFRNLAIFCLALLFLISGFGFDLKIYLAFLHLCLKGRSKEIVLNLDLIKKAQKFHFYMLLSTRLIPSNFIQSFVATNFFIITINLTDQIDLVLPTQIYYVSSTKTLEVKFWGQQFLHLKLHFFFLDYCFRFISHCFFVQLFILFTKFFHFPFILNVTGSFLSKFLLLKNYFICLYPEILFFIAK